MSRKTVLVCDDSTDVLRVCSLSLRSKYNVLVAKSGEECISLCSALRDNKTRIDLFLLDYQLEDMTAEDVLSKIEEMFERAKAILISGYDVEELRLSKLGKRNIVVSQLKKPFSISDLIEKVAFHTT